MSTSLKLALATLTCPLLLSSNALANELLPTRTAIDTWEQLSQDTQENSTMSQVTSVSQRFFVITNPEHNDNNDTVYIGTIRTTLTF
jgi:hypothetical protein